MTELTNWYRLPERLKNVDTRVTQLEVSKVIVGDTTLNIIEVPFGTSLIPGERYYVSIANGDDFTNVGYVEDEKVFVATGTTPTLWQASGFPTTVSRIVVDTNIYYNNLDPNFEAVPIENLSISFNLTNSGYVLNKTLPNIIDAKFVVIQDSNTITFKPQVEKTYFKIEVYK